ncbi:LON peptidase substrate-binding domain-containing protein [Blastococcus goldschmidtiae]|uniref:LON peptidase substrate-binding domain-containing protein n=1 Tax=Blastococcus goldschmidtiae TaxID=3075546 RepID=A0ABU2K9T7_9ACTN|nr:LON peptidase substrate-binding domain-containing protein [Blastococcus sp. DSM 46792]MDT0276903.1 LON peptidase substrate-binding domain-containing protein [Blastococcus sp. DSM 46792]
MGELIPLFPLGTPLFPGVVLPLHVFEPRYRRLVLDLLAMPEESDRRFFGVVAIRQGWEVERIAPAEALYDIGCVARLQMVRPQSDGGFRVVTVGGERFRLRDVVVGDDPPYLQGEVEWLADEEAAEEAAGDAEGLVLPGSGPAAGGTAGPGAPPPCDEHLDEVVASVARNSLALLASAVQELFTDYVDEVADLGAGSDGEDAERAALLAAVAGDPTALSWLVASAALLTTEDRQALLAESATRRRLAAETRLLRRELTLLRELGAVPAPLQRFATPMTVN